MSSNEEIGEEPCPKWSEEETHEGHFFDRPFGHGRAHCPGYTKIVLSSPPERYREQYPEMICERDAKHGWHRWLIEGGSAEDIYLCPGLPRWDVVEERFSDLVDRRLRDWDTGKLIEPEQPREGDQPLPVPNDRPSMHDLVVVDMLNRKSVGYQRYGSFLQPFNGRNSLRDLYEELLDAIVYVRQVIEEDNEHLGQATALRAELERRDHGLTEARNANRRLTAEKDGLEQALADGRNTIGRLRRQLRDAGIDAE